MSLNQDLKKMSYLINKIKLLIVENKNFNPEVLQLKSEVINFILLTKKTKNNFSGDDIQQMSLISSQLINLSKYIHKNRNLIQQKLVISNK